MSAFIIARKAVAFLKAHKARNTQGAQGRQAGTVPKENKSVSPSTVEPAPASKPARSDTGSGGRRHAGAMHGKLAIAAHAIVVCMLSAIEAMDELPDIVGL